MTAELVHLAVQSGIATITLDSPANRNALSSALRAQLSDALARSAGDDSIRAVVLDHTGPVFCAGMDLTEPPDAVSELPGILERISNHPKPVVAKLGGHARAGGIGLLAAADIAVAAQHATFAFSEVRIGVVPAVISVTVLPRVLRHAARELFLTGETFDAARKSADLLLSPVVDRRSTAAPPLVWLECLATGQPILTTRFPGAEEAVEDHRSGFLVETPAEGAERLSEMKADRGLRTRLRDGARQVAVERYSVEDSLRAYVELWSDLDARSKGRESRSG